MLRGIIFIIRLALGIGVSGLTIASILALLGFLTPLFDAFNHLQIILFISTLLGFLLVLAVFINSTIKIPVVILAATGFFASAITVVPEQAGGIFYKPSEPNGQPVIKLMSNNMFGLNYDMDRMARIIGEENPDIIALQEYFGFQQRSLNPKIAARYPFFMICGGRKQSYIALYSKTDFTLQDGTQCASNPEKRDNPAARIIARLKDQNDNEYTIVVTHLNWPIQINPLFRDELDFGQKLFAMSARKQNEWAELSAKINNIAGPVIVAGDFNSTAWSYAMERFTKDTGLIRHSKGMLTYPKLLYIAGEWRETAPFLSIDHILASGDVFMQNIRTGEQTGSDHLPLYAQFSVGQSEGKQAGSE